MKGNSQTGLLLSQGGRIQKKGGKKRKRKTGVEGITVFSLMSLLGKPGTGLYIVYSGGKTGERSRCVTKMIISILKYLLFNGLVDRQHIPFYSTALRMSHGREQRR